ncbi:AMP-binding protein [Mycobacterium sp. M1]|uniref:AMP-binding protein n=1 Tax=Mycolicibacter acidiphilus TaxID=2835306 RepID=A0ABS5RJS2_9MYCO|nr:AMP-binding protein [Mycolicibacter acidiphilus]MBS9533828.1 AMP-binding protein [Mycolicibacter acidiphilus]
MGDHSDTYADAYARSLADPSSFWLAAADAIDWTRRPSRGVDDSTAPFYRWFADGVLNTCYNALDRHVAAGHGARTALIYDSPVTGVKRRYSYAELTDEVARFAGALVSLGVGKGDRVVLYLPMVPQAVIAMLACARIGAIHSVVFGGFAPRELAARITELAPKVLVCASCGIEPSRVVEYKPNVDEAIAAVAPEHRPQSVVVLQRPSAVATMTERDVDYDELLARAEPTGCVDVAATDELYVLYTSGTTGRSKGVVRDNGGHAVALAWAMRSIFDVGPGDVWWAASDVGWAVGHSLIAYGPLLVGATSVLYEGKPVGTPDAGAFWRVIADYRVKSLFVAPTAIRAIRKADPAAAEAAKYDLSGFRMLFLAGERLDPATYRWAGEHLGVPVIDNWWQTETGWPVVANPVGLQQLPVKVGSPSVRMPGYDVRVLDEDGNEVPAGVDGAICIKLPLPPGTLPTLWHNDDGYRASYLSRYPGYYLTGDGGHLDADGYLYVMGRTDDIINVAGHRLSTGAFEAVLAAHPAVAECVVIGVQDTLKGQVPRGLVVLKSGVDVDAGLLQDELIAAVRGEIGAVAAFQQVSIVDGLPKNRSGKILRAAMRAMADGQDTPPPATIEDPGVLEQLRPVLQPAHRIVAGA